MEQATDTARAIGEGTLYPTRHRLESRGLTTAEWGVSDNNRQAKYHRLARARLQADSSAWRRFVGRRAGAPGHRAGGS